MYPVFALTHRKWYAQSGKVLWTENSERFLKKNDIYMHHSSSVSTKHNHWLLVKIPSAEILRAAQHIPRWWIEGCHVIIRKTWPWTIVRNVFGECHTRSMLKKYFVDFKKEYVLQKIEIVVYIQISILFLWQSKGVVAPVGHTDCWMLSSNRSINLNTIMVLR